jgi:hypothetical protein
MIISASRRTDVPAFYSEWLINRIKEGYCLTVNPNNPKLVRRVELAPDVIDAFIFWTKNPKPMFSKLDFLDKLGYSYVFLYTLNNYPTYLEPHIPDLENRIDSFSILSSRLCPDRVIWRYDPVILTSSITFDFHVNNFQILCSRLKGLTNRVIISFLDTYSFVPKRIKNSIPPGDELLDFSTIIDKVYLLSEQLSQIAKKHGMEIYSCAEIFELKNAGILPGACIDGLYLTRIFGKSFSTKKDKGQRPECNCVIGVDIGQYDTCRNRCTYCYANKNDKVFERNVCNYDVHAPALTGWPDYKPPTQQKLL